MTDHITINSIKSLESVEPKIPVPEQQTIRPEQQAEALLEYTQKIMTEALASCEVPVFTPIELQIPQVIPVNAINQLPSAPVTMPSVEHYFSSARDLWQTMTTTP